MDLCLICQEEVETKRNRQDKFFIVKCPRCGTYHITEEALEDFPKKISLRARANASGWLRENEGSLISSSSIPRLLNQRTPSFHERADKVLLAFEKRTSFAGEFVKREKSLISIGWCIMNEELDEILEFLKTSQRVFRQGVLIGEEFKITSAGWEHLEMLKKTQIDSQQGFVAMWFDDAMTKIYDDIIAPAIEDSGYKPHKVDLREHNDRIDDEIIAQIRRSRFVLADFTGHRGGVYYEAGFAKGLGLEVFWTCRKDELDYLHFDIRQYNCIVWEKDNKDDFKKRITNRIESVLGRGTYKS